MIWEEKHYLCPPSDEKRSREGLQKATALKPQSRKDFGSVVQLVRMLPCHGRGRGFESRPVRCKSDKTRAQIEFAGFFFLVSCLFSWPNYLPSIIL
jgi:hypothetical protein